MLGIQKHIKNITLGIKIFSLRASQSKKRKFSLFGSAWDIQVEFGNDGK